MSARPSSSNSGGNVDHEDQAAAGGPIGKKVFKLLLKLDDANDNTVLVAAQKLVSALKADGSDLRTLADAMGAAWEKEQKAKPAPPPPIDYAEVEAAVTRYAADKTKVTQRGIWKAVIAAVPAVNEHRTESGISVTTYIFGCLRRLGFNPVSRALSTWQRRPQNDRADRD